MKIDTLLLLESRFFVPIIGGKYDDVSFGDASVVSRTICDELMFGDVMSNQEQPMDNTPEQISEAEQAMAAGAADAASSGAEQALVQQLATAEAALQEEKDRALRLAAEMDNLRRRVALDVEKAHKFALEKFVNELLPVIDSLERALDMSDRENEQLKPMLEGVDLTLRSLLGAVNKFGVEVVDPQNEPFDPNRHQAMSMLPNAEVAPNTVLAVMQKGYELNGRIVRPAMVMVSRAPNVDTQA